MRCPFCIEEINEEATVCKYCHRDLAIPAPLLTHQLKKLHTSNDHLNAEVRRLHERLRRTSARMTASDRLHVSIAAARYVFAPIAFLLIAHYVISVHLDAKAIYLRILSLAIPFPFGFDMRWRVGLGPYASITFGIIVAIVAVAGMLLMTHFASPSAEPFLPTDWRGWQEDWEYAASIALAMVAGNLAATAVHRVVPEADETPDSFSLAARGLAWIVGLRQEDQGFADKLKSIEKVITAATAVLTALAAFFTGIKGLLR
jgi:hypothetical protein